jgi:hypothetical protein
MVRTGAVTESGQGHAKLNYTRSIVPRTKRRRLMKLMNRTAESDFIAMLTAQAMEDEGAQVISITYDGSDTHPNALVPHSKFIVFARARDWAHIKRIDEAIDKALKNAAS